MCEKIVFGLNNLCYMEQLDKTLQIRRILKVKYCDYAVTEYSQNRPRGLIKDV